MAEENNFSKTNYFFNNVLVENAYPPLKIYHLCLRHNSAARLPVISPVKIFYTQIKSREAFIDVKYNLENISQSICSNQMDFPFKFPARFRFFTCYSVANIVVMKDQTALCFQNSHHVERNMEYQQQR